jgi:glutamate/tyrosine decarboxylase-like PLP-dependent enzyme
MDWSADLLGLASSFKIASGSGGGVIQGTASDSALLAGVAARIRFQRAHPEVQTEQLVLYLSSQTHSLGAKTAMLLGIQSRSLSVTEEDHYSLRGETVWKAYQEDRAAGLWPYCLCEPSNSLHPADVRLNENGFSCHCRHDIIRRS